MKYFDKNSSALKLGLAIYISITTIACQGNASSNSTTGEQEQSGSSGNTTTELPETGAVSAQKVTAGDSEALLTWDPIQGAGEYAIYYSTDTTLDRNTATKLNDSVGTITGTSAAVVDLSNESQYYF